LPLSNLDHYLELLEAIPVPLFIVDDDVQVLAVNTAAKEKFGFAREAFYLRRGGEILHCLHAHDVPEGCGRGPLCGSCVIRNSVAGSLASSRVIRRRMKFQRRSPSGLQELELLISAQALPQAGPNITVLTIEDVTEVTRLRNIVPICMVCKKVRDDGEYWQHVETYFQHEIGLDFSHGICPECEAQYRRQQGLDPAP
jgi:PAS domain-containing protein